MTRPSFVILFGLLGTCAAAQMAPEVDDCTVYYREDYEALFAEQQREWREAGHERLAYKERRHRRHPRDHENSLRLAQAYADAGRLDEAEQLASALTAHRRARREEFALLLAYYAARGQFDDAEALIARYERRFGTKKRSDEWSNAVELVRVLTSEHTTPEDIIALALPVATRYAVAAELAFRQGDVVAGLLLTEALYYLGGFTSVPQSLIQLTRVIKRDLLTSVAHGEGWPFSEHPAGSERAACVDALVRGTAEAAAVIGDYPSILEFYADVRLRTQRHWDARPANGRDDKHLVTRILNFTKRVADDGHFRWVSLARLREADRRYFDALVCTEAAAWIAVQDYFEDDLSMLRLELSGDAMFVASEY